METATQPRITVIATVQAPVQKVWDYWTKPEHITQWCQASDDWHAPYADNDAVTGGTFKTTMAAKDGSMSFDFEGVYDEVRPQEKISYTMSDGRKVDVLFRAEGSGTRIEESFDPENMNSREMQQSGWQAILDNFKNYVERH